MPRLEPIATRHDAVMYACCLIAFLSVAAHGVGPIFAALFVIAWATSYLLYRSGRHRHVPLKAWNMMTLATVGFTGAMMYFSEESVLDSGVRFILMLIAIKLLSRRGSERDDWQIYALTFLLMAAATAVNEDLLYGLVFALYVVLGTFGLAMLHLRTEQRRRGQSASETTTTSKRLYHGVLAGLALAVFASSVLIFFAFPRVGLGFFATKSRPGVAMTGFSDRVELGSHGLIRDNPETVMRVMFDQDRMPAEATGYHWRMMAFDRYDGVRWSRTHKDQQRVLERESASPPSYALQSLYGEEALKPGGTMAIYMEPIKASQLPHLWPTRRVVLANSVNLPFNPARASLQLDMVYGDLYLKQRNELGLAYELERAEPPELDAEATYALQEAETQRLFLQRPEGHERLEALAERVTAEATTPLEVARALELHLRSSYAYTTDLPPVQGDYPVESFLFVTKRGHCEFFATTMVLMLRARGIPSRLVNGFLGGVWNATGQYMAVRQGDAHSWVEAYLPEHGWVPFDPTPASGVEPIAPGGLEQWTREVYDAAKMRWMLWVVEYDLEAQIASARRLSRWLAPRTGASSGQDSAASRPAERGSPQAFDALRAFLPELILALLSVMAFFHARSTQQPRGIKRRSNLKRALRGALLLALWCGVGYAWMRWQRADRSALGVALPLGAILAAHAVSVRRGDAQAARARAHQALRRVERGAKRARIAPRREDEGAERYLERLAQERPELNALIKPFTRAYLSARFDTSRSLGPDELRELRRSARALARALTR